MRQHAKKAVARDDIQVIFITGMECFLYWYARKLLCPYKTSHSDFANTYRKFNNTVNFELNQVQKAVTQGSLI
ncbi:MAG: hypothetical protein EBU46_12475 [Nitrosomonadaceae bacterium]|nr:hypothetical protein [Nitrosomonadaceae bacterium]